MARHHRGGGSARSCGWCCGWGLPPPRAMAFASGVGDVSRAVVFSGEEASLEVLD